MLILTAAGLAGVLLDRFLTDGDAGAGRPSDEVPGAARGDQLREQADQPSDLATDGQPNAVAGPPPDGVPDDAEPAIVDTVVDGDTVRVIALPGGSIPEGGSIRIRLLNVDAPEVGGDGRDPDCGAAGATDHLVSMIDGDDVVWLVADREDQDRYGRPLRGMWTADGRFLNESLAEAGHADVLLVPPNDRFHARIAAAVDRAQAAGRGIWGTSCRG